MSTQQPNYGTSFAARRGGEPCHDCKADIRRGDVVRYRYLADGRALTHLDCEAARGRADAERTEAPYELHGSSGYGSRGWKKGQTLRSSDELRAEGWPEFVTVVSADSEYIREDGLSFGVGDEQGYLYTARCRAATEEEAAPVRARIAARAARAEAQRELEEIARRIQADGECPEGDHVLAGEEVGEVGSERRLYGGGTWFVLEGSGAIWWVRNNGADGDDWRGNNVRTGGAGAIGWRVAADPKLAERLRALDAIVRGGPSA